jgi:hypothetical protein
VTVEEAWQS